MTGRKNNDINTYVTNVFIVGEDSMARNKYPELTVEKILEVSQRLFLEKGYEQTTIQDIVDNLSKNGVERAYTTIKTVMDRLTVKSILVRYKVGKKFYYRATMTKEEMASEAIQTLSEQFFSGSYSQMVEFIEEKALLV